MDKKPDTPTRFWGHAGVGPIEPLTGHGQDVAEVSSFTAEVEFRFVAESLEHAGSSLRDLADAARTAGFELRQARVEPASEEFDERPGWTRYGPDEASDR
jgi:hypothetical protein